MVNVRHQKGVVLVVSLVFLIALVGVAAALMQNSTSDIRMSGASEEKVTSVQEAISSTDEVIYKQVEQIGGNNGFAIDINAYPTTPSVSAYNTEATISVVNPNMLEASCPHSKSGSSIQVFTCNVLNVEVQRKYGREGNHEVVVNSGIAQQLLNVGG